ncbi:hypothetical protein BDW59DRAFT_146744 [Aspergillus cavernicola]|uniref:Uncharacterized protein n=1 Tax=Aspergillus cavernicola TaxID=176166 RepID=A0ABR4IBP7_9EURO
MFRVGHGDLDDVYSLGMSTADCSECRPLDLQRAPGTNHPNRTLPFLPLLLIPHSAWASILQWPGAGTGTGRDHGHCLASKQPAHHLPSLLIPYPTTIPQLPPCDQPSSPPS